MIGRALMRPASSLERRIALVAIAVVLVLTAITSRREALHRGALRDWSATSSLVLGLTGAAAQSWIAERTGDLHLLTVGATKSPALFNIVVPGRPHVAPEKIPVALAHAVEQLRHAHGAQYTRLWIFDAHGRPVASSSGQRPTAEVLAVAAASLRTDSVLVGQIFTRPDGSVGVAFAQRVTYAGPDHPTNMPANGIMGSVAVVVDPRIALFPALTGGRKRRLAERSDETTALLMAYGDTLSEYTLETGARRRWMRDSMPHAEWAALTASLEPEDIGPVNNATAHLVADGAALVDGIPGTPWAVVRRAPPAAVFASADTRLTGECATVVALAGLALWLLLMRRRIAEAQRARDVAESERRYRLVTDNAMDVIARHSGDECIDYVSPAVTWVLGYDPDEVLGRTLAELGHPDDAAAIAALFRNARGHAGTSRLEHRLRDASGNAIWVETLARAVDGSGDDRANSPVGGAPEIITVTRDVSTRKDAEVALREALEFIHAVVASSPIAIVATDLEGRVIQWNGAAERLYGWTAAEVIGMPYPIGDAELGEEVQRNRERTIRLGHLTDVPVRRRRKDGSLVDIALSSGVLHDASGTPAGFIVLASDLTDRLKLEAQLRQSQKMDAIGQLAGGIAHDFNNLLTVVTSYASLLLKELPAGNAIREDLVEIHAAAKRGAALVGQLLAFSRQQVLTPQPIDINALVAETKAMLRRVLPPKITLRKVLGERAGVIEADRGQIEQVLTNLVVNARDAIGDATGTITITTACEPSEPLEYGDGTRHNSSVIGPDAHEVVIRVRDTGHGIPGDLLERIFDPFFTTKERGQGTGLGLSTVQGIVAQSGGRITVRSEVGVGTEFELRFPAVDRDPVMLDSPASGSSSDGSSADDRSAEPRAGQRPTTQSSGVVLLVEDDARVRRVTARILERAGFDVIAAGDGAEALAIYEAQAARIDVIVTDMMMPELTGAEMIACIRAAGGDVPALFMSGHTTLGPVATQMIEGSRFIQKPFTPDELTAKARDAVARRALATGTWAVPASSRLTHR